MVNVCTATFSTETLQVVHTMCVCDSYDSYSEYDNFPIKHSLIDPSHGSKLLCVMYEQYLFIVYINFGLPGVKKINTCYHFKVTHTLCRQNVECFNVKVIDTATYSNHRPLKNTVTFA